MPSQPYDASMMAGSPLRALHLTLLGLLLGCRADLGSEALAVPATGQPPSAVTVSEVSAPVRPVSPPDFVELLATVPDDATNAFVLRIDQSEAGSDDWERAFRESEALVAFGLSVLPLLPFPDELIVHVLTQSMYDMLYVDADSKPQLGVAWFVRFDEMMGLPRAVGAMVHRHSGTRAHGGCSAEAPRDARGFKVHNQDGALYNTICVDDRRAVGAAGEHTNDLLERLASKKTGSSPAGTRLLARGLPDDVWAGGAWSGKDQRWPILEAELSVGREAADGSFAIRVRVRALPGQRPAVEAALAGAQPKLRPIASAIVTRAATQVQGDAVEWTFRMSREEAKQLYEEAPDQSPAALIKARGGRVTR